MILDTILDMGYQINDTGLLCKKENNKSIKSEKEINKKVKQFRDDTDYFCRAFKQIGQSAVKVLPINYF